MSRLSNLSKHYWRKCCLAVGLGEPSYELSGATLQDADKAQSYLTKFKTAQEMTGASKVAKGSSRNQWQLLQDSMGGDAFAGSLFVEYAEAFKGQRQLTWSRGLKNTLILNRSMMLTVKSMTMPNKSSVRTLFIFKMNNGTTLDVTSYRLTFLTMYRNA